MYFLKFYVIASTFALSRNIEDHNTMLNRDMTFAETKPPEKKQRLDVDDEDKYFDCQN